MSKISAIIICKNEEERIERCIKSVDFCDQIIIIDSGSTDGTLNIARKYTTYIYHRELQDFSQLRNFGLSKAKSDWVFYIDADEEATTELQKSIKESLVDSSFAAYKIRRKNFYFSNYEWPYVELLERLFRRKDLKAWHGKLHESPIVEGDIGVLSGYLNHYTHRTLSEMIEKTNKWSEVEAKNRFDSDHPEMTIYRFPKIMIKTFCNYYFSQGGYRIGTAGFIESMYQAFSIFITYAKLWEMQQARNKK